MQNYQQTEQSQSYRQSGPQRLSPEISEFMHMLSALEDRLSAKLSNA